MLRRFLEKAGTLDRRIIFLLMGLAIILPLLFPLGLPVKTHRPVEAIYEAVEKLQPGDRVLVAADFDPGAKPELYPFLIAIYHHLFQKQGVKVISTSLWLPGPPLVAQALDETAERTYQKTYGEDYVNLGFKEGRHLVILALGENLRSTYPADWRGTPIDQLPALNGINNLSDFALIVSVSAGTPGTKEWVQLAQSRYGLPMVASCTAVSAPDYIPYFQSGQLIGLAGGMAGSAEYEALIDYKKITGKMGQATIGMDVLSIGHFLIVLAVILGNISYFMTRKKKRS